MERKFLENFKVGDQPLTKEVVDAILAENVRDVEAAKKPFADYEAIKEQLQTARDGLKAFEGVDVAQLQGEVAKLQGQLASKDREWQGKLDAMAFDGKIKDAVTAAGGKSAKAIAALLDLDTLRASKNQDADIKAALEELKKDSGYLFDDGQLPPPYAPGTGTTQPAPSGTFNFGFTGVRAHEAAK